MAGVGADQEVGIQEARIISNWMVEMKRAPSPNRFCQGLIDQTNVDPMAGMI